MCQCGCVESAMRLRLKAPRGYYVLTLCVACDYCEVGPEVMVEHVAGEEAYLTREDSAPLDLSGGPRAIACGPNRHEFVAALIPHLEQLADDDGELLGRDGADVYAVEAWCAGVSELLHPRLVERDATGGGEGGE